MALAAAVAVAAFVLAALPFIHAFAPYQNPRWSPTWDIQRSTLTMACNSSGFYDATFAGQFGIVSFDWSNAKAMWANARPMNDEELMAEQAAKTRAADPDARVFVYRNLVKALPWLTSVREKLEDPAYAGFFLRFKPGGAFPNGTYHVPACTDGKCSPFYHDQEQTPEHPTPADPHPDGACTAQCDCGHVPCGEYLFDHRNGTQLADWLVEEYVFGPLGLGHPDIDGLFIDDFWCSRLINGTCTDPVQGPSEVNAHSQADMGLSDEDVRDITEGWLRNTARVQQAIVDRHKYTWSLIPGQANANASPVRISRSTCSSILTAQCAGGGGGGGGGQDAMSYDKAPLLFGLTMGNSTHPLPDVREEVAAFQLMRGPYAWIGAGVWGMTWPAGVGFDAHHKRYAVPLPPQMKGVDYGEPLEACRQTAPGLFERHFSKAHISLDCTSYAGKLTLL